MVIQIVRIKSALSEQELLGTAHERAPQFEAIPGLIQKYYVRLRDPGQYGGIYIWDSPESLQEFKQSELASTIAQAYKASEAPDIEILDVLFRLRE
jgi:heme-degrading monooxygenase HmoA